MGNDQEYTFTFRVFKSNAGREYVRRVARRHLLENFDKALDWMNADRAHRNVTLEGPRVLGCVVSARERGYLIDHVLDAEDLPQDKGRVLGLLWADVTDAVEGVEMRLYKIVETTENWPEYEAPVVEHRLEEVAPESWRSGIEWARANGWLDRGVWYRGKPAVVFSNRPERAIPALADVPGFAEHLETGKVELAPCRYDWQQSERPYLFITPTRPAHRIRELRSRYPTAEEDLAVCPTEVLIKRYGYKMEFGQILPASRSGIE